MKPEGIAEDCFGMHFQGAVLGGMLILRLLFSRLIIMMILNPMTDGFLISVVIF
jgi:hypothetical protein